VGIVVGKRTGKATVRNRVKRRIREAARTLYPSLPLGHDIIVIARPAAAEVPTQTLLDVLRGLMERATAGRVSVPARANS
jgi:ribonuclease P protein component